MKNAGHPDEPPVDREHPWPGLVAFTEDARNFFFGREREEDELVRRIGREVTTLFFGQSGLGKTSLLQAGLAPQLRGQGFVPVVVRLSYDEDANSPVEQFRNLFEQAMSEAAPEAPALAEHQTLWEYLHRRDPSHGADGATPPIPVFLIDQFEEAFTLGLSREKVRPDTQHFLTDLADLIENRCPSAVKARLEQDPAQIEQFSFGRNAYRIVIAMREDYLPQMEALRTRAPSLGRNRFRLTRMDGTQALNAVVEPGAGLIEPEVAEEIVRLVARRRPDDPFGLSDGQGPPQLAELEVEPSLLSLFCSELNERRIEQKLERITADMVKLSRDSILESFYERAFRGLPDRLRDFVEHDLVTDSGVRESVAVERATKSLGHRPGMRKSLDELVRRRLLHVEERFEVPRVELTHDLLTEVAVRSRDRRRRRRNARRWGAVAALALLAAITVFGWDRFVSPRQSAAAAGAWSVAASACDAKPASQACTGLPPINDKILRGLADPDVRSMLLSLTVIQNHNFTAGDVRSSLTLLGHAETLLANREGYELYLAGILADKAERERLLNDPSAAMRDTRRAQALFNRLIPALQRGRTDMDREQLDDSLGTLATLNYQSAFLDPANKSGFLTAATELQNERVRLAEAAIARSRDDDDGDARRDLVFALGSRSWGYVLANNPPAAIADARRAIEMDPSQRWILGNHGDALVLQGRLDDAIALFRSIKDAPGIPPYGSLCFTINDDMHWLWTLRLVQQPTVRRVAASLNCGPAPNFGR